MGQKSVLPSPALAKAVRQFGGGAGNQQMLIEVNFRAIQSER
jgi:hypothetical protein